MEFTTLYESVFNDDGLGHCVPLFILSPKRELVFHSG